MITLVLNYKQRSIMKFRLASLFFLLSGTTFFNSPALSMTEFDEVGSPSSSKGVLVMHMNPLIRQKVDFDALVRTYNVLRAQGNAAPDTELVGFLVGEQNWKLLSRFNQKQYANGIAERAQDLRLEELMRESGILSKYCFARSTGNAASDEELVAFLLSENWATLTPPSQIELVDRVTSMAEKLEVEKIISESGIIPSYRAVRLKNDASDDDLVAYLLGDKWETLTSSLQDLLVYKVTKRSDKMDRAELFSLIRSGKLEEAFDRVMAADTTGLLSDEMIVKHAFENLGFKGTLSFIGSIATVKDPMLVLEAFVEDEKVEDEIAKSYRSMKTVNQDVPDEKIVKTILEKMGYKYWDRLLPKDRELIVGVAVESSLMPEWLPPYFDDRQVEVLFTDDMNEENREHIIKEAQDIDEMEDLAPRIAAVKASVARLFTPGMTGADRALIIGEALRVEATGLGFLVDAIVSSGEKLFPSFHRASLTHHHLQKTEDEIHDLAIEPLSSAAVREIQTAMRIHAQFMSEH